MTEEDVRKIIQDELRNNIKIDRYVFDKFVQFLDGRDIETGRTTGTTFAPKTGQKVGFFGSATTQYGAISDPSGGATVDTEARNKISSILNALRAIGIIDT